MRRSQDLPLGHLCMSPVGSPGIPEGSLINNHNTYLKSYVPVI